MVEACEEDYRQEQKLSSFFDIIVVHVLIPKTCFLIFKLSSLVD